jgi:mutator protein MutT
MKLKYSIIILYESGKILLQKRTMGSPRLAGKWAFFGGGIEDGEDSREAVIREAKEELDYELNSPMLIKRVDLYEDKNELYLYSEKFDSSKELKLQEGESFGWFSKEDINDMDMGSVDKEILLGLDWDKFK